MEKATSFAAIPLPKPAGSEPVVADMVFSEPKVGWFLGAYINDENLTETFVEQGVWRLGGEPSEAIRDIKPGTHVAIKKSFTRIRDIPFENYGDRISVMGVIARGIVAENPGDGLSLKVNWDKDFQPKEWFFFNYQPTIWMVEREDADGDWRRGALLDFAFNDKPQDIHAFCNHDFWKARYGDDAKRDSESSADSEAIEENNLASEFEEYSKQKFLEEAFMSSDDYDTLAGLLDRKLNVVLQGAPGTGKTFVAKRLAYSLMGYKDKSHIAFKQFHQGTTYEDMIVGFSPVAEGGQPTFERKEGAFVRFCDKAVDDPERPYFFIIDEINRANVSSVFGELLMTIEKGHRDETVDIDLRPGRTTFSVPSNVHIIAMMNTADRSIAMMDYALRRRFAFFEMKPAIGTAQFKEYLESVFPDTFAECLIKQVLAVNDIIEERLGSGYRIGHSYFMLDEKTCRKLKGRMDEVAAKKWFANVLEFEIEPLLKEYWYDDEDSVKQCVAQLRKVIE